jgi:hypothetical protein
MVSRGRENLGMGQELQLVREIQNQASNHKPTVALDYSYRGGREIAQVITAIAFNVTAE